MQLVLFFKIVFIEKTNFVFLEIESDSKGTVGDDFVAGDTKELAGSGAEVDKELKRLQEHLLEETLKRLNKLVKETGLQF